MNEPSLDVTFQGNRVATRQGEFELEYPIREAFECEGRVVVLLEPDAMLADPAYTPQRRRGEGALPNLLAYSPAGERLWAASFPEPADYYYRVVSRQPLVVLSFSSWRCWIDLADGSIVRKEWLK